jgi:hypothetical protein
MFIMMTLIILLMSSYGGNKVVGWGLPEGNQVPTPSSNPETIPECIRQLDTLVEMYHQCTTFEINDEYESGWCK